MAGRWLVSVFLALALAAVVTAVVVAQDGPTQQQQEVNSSQGQDVIINLSCEQGAVCNQHATVGGQAPPEPAQVYVAPPPVAQSPGNCPEGRAWDDDFGRCTAIQLHQNQKAERLGYTIAIGGLVLMISIVVLRWLDGGSDKYSGGYY